MARASSNEPWRTSEKTKWTDRKINKKGQHPWRTYNILQGKLAVTETVNFWKKSRWLRDILLNAMPHPVRCEKRKEWKYGEPDRNHHWQTGTDWNTQRRTEN